MLLIGHPHVLAGRDCFWYVDNTVALSAVVKGSSSDADMARAAAAIHLAMALAGTRVWFEYIESESNWADEPSRKLWCSSFLRELQFLSFPGSIPAWPWVEEDERVSLLQAAFLSAVGSGSSAVGDPLPTSPFGITIHCQLSDAKKERLRIVVCFGFGQAWSTRILHPPFVVARFTCPCLLLDGHFGSRV
jgi:hypothetical protein